MARELKPCGTPAAYRRHLRRGEDPCRACLDAEAARTRPAGVAPRAPSPHGTNGRYSKGCRCAPCTQAHRGYCARWRGDVAGLPGVFFGHGASGYRNYGCRCAVCVEGNRVRCREYRARRRERAAASV